MVCSKSIRINHCQNLLLVQRKDRMMQCKIGLLVLFLIVVFNHADGQTIRGKVIDASSKEPLPFVTILYQQNPPNGIMSDIDGNFALYNKKISTLSFAYLGYKPHTINLAGYSGDLQHMMVELTAVSVELEEVTVYPGENPAHRIIRKAIENRNQNNPEKLSSYSCTIYNKLFLDPKISKYANAQDSADYKSITTKLKGAGMLMIESVSNRKFVRPDRIEDKVIATKVSGFQDPSFTFLGTSFQPFAFYSEVISLMNVNYVNPISPGSTRNYHFRMKDTIVNDVNGTDTTFVISYEPFPKKNFSALKGVLYINTHNFAIENVIAEPYDKGLFEFKIQQKYQLVNDHWFPDQLLFEARLTKQPFIYSGSSYIKDVEIEPPIKAVDLGLEFVNIDDNAGRKDEAFWQHVRADSLTARQKLTYQKMDSLGRRFDFDSKLKFVEDIAFGEVPLGVFGKSPFSIFNVDLTKIYYKNNAEGTRLGMGLLTNDKLSKVIAFGGYIGYGFKDKVWKYGADVDLTINKYHETHFKLGYQNTKLEPGKTDLRDLLKDNINNYFGNYAISRLDKVIEYSAEVSFRTLKYAEVQISLHKQSRFPTYEYAFRDQELQQTTNISYIQAFVKYSFGEKLEKVFRRRISHGSKYPTLYFTYSRGFNGLLNGTLNYNRYEAGLYKAFTMKKLGVSKIRIEGGYVDKRVPLFLLFTADGSKDRNAPFSVATAFQTMSRYEFLSDQYVNIFYTHNFGSIFIKTKNFKPQFSVFQNIGYGSLVHPEYHNLIEVKTLEKGYLESGVGLSDLLRVNIKNYLYLGLGIEAYYRWGAYTHIKPVDNTALKLNIHVSF